MIGYRQVMMSKADLLPETIAYIARVTSDGGQVMDVKYTNSIFAKAKSMGILASGIVGLSYSAGIKLSSGKVTKRYNLFSSNDEIQPDSAKMGVFKEAACRLNYRSYMTALNSAAYISALTLPAHFDMFFSGFITDLFFEHSSGVSTSVPGFFLWNPANPIYRVYRGAANDYTVCSDGAFFSGSKGVGRMIYNETNRLLYKNGIVKAVSSRGTLVNDSNATDALYLYSKNNTGTTNAAIGQFCDFFIFSQLAKSNSDSFESFVINSIISPTVNFNNVLTEGDSQMTNVGGATLWPSELEKLSSRIFVTNKAVGGRTANQVDAGIATNLAAAYDPSAKNICIIQAGVNDMALGSATPAQAYAYLSSAAAKSNAAGFSTCMCTQTNWGSTGTPAGNWVLTQTFNDLIRNGASAGNYTVIDWMTNDNWNQMLSFQDRTWFFDNIHKTDASHLEEAQRVLNSISAIMI